MLAVVAVAPVLVQSAHDCAGALVVLYCDGVGLPAAPDQTSWSGKIRASLGVKAMPGQHANGAKSPTGEEDGELQLDVMTELVGLTTGVDVGNDAAGVTTGGLPAVAAFQLVVLTNAHPLVLHPKYEKKRDRVDSHSLWSVENPTLPAELVVWG